MNIGPNREGLLPELDAVRLTEFGKEVRRRFGTPLVRFEQGNVNHEGWQYTAEKPILINHLIAQEDLSEGEHIRRFTISIFPTHGSQEIVVYEGRNVGHKAICTFPPVRAREVILKVIESDGSFALRSVLLYCVNE